MSDDYDTHIGLEPLHIDLYDTGIDVCDHIHLPNAYEKPGSAEYVVDLELPCDGCGTTHIIGIKVN